MEPTIAANEDGIRIIPAHSTLVYRSRVLNGDYFTAANTGFRTVGEFVGRHSLRPLLVDLPRSLAHTPDPPTAEFCFYEAGFVIRNAADSQQAEEGVLATLRQNAENGVATVFEGNAPELKVGLGLRRVPEGAWFVHIHRGGYQFLGGKWPKTFENAMVHGRFDSTRMPQERYIVSMSETRIDDELVTELLVPIVPHQQ